MEDEVDEIRGAKGMDWLQLRLRQFTHPTPEELADFEKRQRAKEKLRKAVNACPTHTPLSLRKIADSLAIDIT